MRDTDLAGIPQSITQAKRDALLAELGLVQLDHIRSLVFHANAITAEVIATDDNGDYLVEHNEVMIHTIVIPLVAESKVVKTEDGRTGIPGMRYDDDD
jgi:hypothetical protein